MNFLVSLCISPTTSLSQSTPPQCLPLPITLTLLTAGLITPENAQFDNHPPSLSINAATLLDDC
ncbi:hypothetical protein TSMEX_005473 [Taenia solium]|eukprot:TsM_000023300 transcript=TsM_000023300 gene=TsM_000023300